MEKTCVCSGTTAVLQSGLHTGLSLLPFVSKLLEHATSSKSSCDLLQPGFRSMHSLLKVTDDLLLAKSKALYLVLILLDFSPA